jgi:hypothetical protein
LAAARSFLVAAIPLKRTTPAAFVFRRPLVRFRWIARPLVRFRWIARPRDRAREQPAQCRRRQDAAKGQTLIR